MSVKNVYITTNGSCFDVYQDAIDYDRVWAFTKFFEEEITDELMLNTNEFTAMYKKLEEYFTDF